MPWVEDKPSKGGWVDEKPVKAIHPGMSHPAQKPPTADQINKYKIDEILGNKVDWDKELPFGPRLDLSQSATPQEKLFKLKQQFPKKKFALFGQRIMARDEPKDNWYPIDKPGFRTKFHTSSIRRSTFRHFFQILCCCSCLIQHSSR